MKLLTNNPKKIIGLEGYNLEVVGREPIEIKSNSSNEKYLKTKGINSDIYCQSLIKMNIDNAKLSIVMSDFNISITNSMKDAAVKYFLLVWRSK